MTDTNRPKKYNVTVTADATVSTVVDVMASSPEEAEHLALEEATQSPECFEWVSDDNMVSDPFIADPGNAAEEANDK